MKGSRLSSARETNASAQRVAIVGCGRMGRVRAEACRTLGVRISVVHDVDPDAAARFAEALPGCRAAPSIGVIPWNDLDALFVCTPPAARGKVELAAIEAGVPVLVEKPVGISAGHVADVAQALCRSPVRTAVGYQNRYRRSVRRLRAAVTLRQPFAIACHWVVGAYPKPWWLRADDSGGPLNEQATHLVDLCRHLAGEIVEVTALARDGVTDPGAADTVSVSLRFASGAAGTLLYSFASRSKHIALDVFWTQRHARLEGWDLREPGELTHPDPNAAFVDETAAFLGLRGAVLCDYADGLRTQRTVDAVKEALRTGRMQRPDAVREETPG